MTTDSVIRAHWILGASLLGLFVTACNPSPHIDPPGSTTGTGGSGGSGGSPTTTTSSSGGGGSTTTSTSSSGGSAPTGCASNADCSYPNNLCDVASGTCVECLVTEDCGAKPGTVCSKAACECPAPGQDFCAADGYGAARCSDQATSNKDCGACGHACFGTCAAGECVDAWEPTGAVGAPSPRYQHVAVWTGSVMVVWGGTNGGSIFGDGAMYNPDTREWNATSDVNAPSARAAATAVWTGSRMIVFGGYGPGGAVLGDGASFDPATNSWTALSAAAAPPARYEHSAIWTGNPTTRTIVWGGYDGTTEIATGGYYTAGNTWFELTPSGAPTPRRLHTAVWDDANGRMILFGGLGFDPNSGTTTSLNTGSIYGPLPANEAWTDIGQIGSPPAPRYDHTAVWATNQMIVWGGYNNALGLLGDGARFDAAGNNEWSAMEGIAPSPRRRHTAVFFKAMNKMVVWGGYAGGNAPLADGGIFNVMQGVGWDPSGAPKGPVASAEHTAVVAGNRMIVWGGVTSGGSATSKGAILDMSKVP